MAATALKTLRDAVKRQQFDGAYYIYGEDEFQKNDAVQQIVAAAVDPATRDFNLEFRRGADLNAEIVESLVGTPPMMADRRVVVIRDVNTLKKDARTRLDRYLKNPSPDTVLLLVSTPGAKADKGLSMATTPLEFDPLEDNRIPKWIAHHASTELKVEITPEAADLLQSAVGNDLYQLVAELDKLVSYTNGATITEEAVGEVVGIRRGETIGDLLDKTLEQDAMGALTLVPHILMQPKTTAVAVVMALSTQMLAVAWGRARVDDGLPLGRLEGEFFSLLKSTGAFPMRPWGSAAKAWARAVPQWSAVACRRALDALLAADVALKETRVSSEEQILETAVLALCASESRHYRAA
ncbi:MAG TPA: DNA polymerase III subunit delta [Gemmatimonadaceae bacterium]|jgi:DNA polymerase-3 subunit delta|nr:DNA polymerase III subunit delta [Gemmatimonadaceae bacterium]